MLVNLDNSSVSTMRSMYAHNRIYNKRTFFNRARKKLLTRNLNRSSSVWITMSLKFVFGSKLPV